MGRRKIDVKRIEDKNRRQGTFTKRKGGFFRKAQHLSVACEADVAAVVISDRDQLFEFCSNGGTTTSVQQILSRYKKSCLGAEASTTAGTDHVVECSSGDARFRTCEELLLSVERLVQEPNAEETSINDLVQLEEELGAALMHTRSRKAKLMIEYMSSLREKDRKLNEENLQMEQQLSLVKETGNGDDGGGGIKDIATNQLSTLPLFTF